MATTATAARPVARGGDDGGGGGDGGGGVDSFAGLIRSLAEPGPGPHADNFVSNEDSYTRIGGEVEAFAAREPGSVYLGVGPDQNFTLIARSRPSRAFVIDHRRRNARLHLLHKAFFQLSTDRAGYLSRLTARRPVGLDGGRVREADAEELASAFERARFDRGALEAARAEARGALEPLGVLSEGEWADLESIQARLAGPGLGARFLAMPGYPTLGAMMRRGDREGNPGHFLAREEWYGVVRGLQARDGVVPLTGDFGAAPGPEACLSRLAAHLERTGGEVGLFYVSDVEFFLLRGDRGKFRAYLTHLRRLPRRAGALLARTSTREIARAARVAGDSSTTIAEPIEAFLERAGRDGEGISGPDDLFPER